MSPRAEAHRSPASGSVSDRPGCSSLATMTHPPSGSFNTHSRRMSEGACVGPSNTSKPCRPPGRSNWVASSLLKPDPTALAVYWSVRVLLPIMCMSPSAIHNHAGRSRMGSATTANNSNQLSSATANRIHACACRKNRAGSSPRPRTTNWGVPKVPSSEIRSLCQPECNVLTRTTLLSRNRWGAEAARVGRRTHHGVRTG